jgi:predicted transcriptional regulator
MAIIGDILRSLRSPNGRKKKTQIMQSANLNCMQFDKYLRYLLRYGFLKVTEKGEIQMTDEGAKFLLFLETKQIPTIV